MRPEPGPVTALTGLSGRRGVNCGLHIQIVSKLVPEMNLSCALSAISIDPVVYEGLGWNLYVSNLHNARSRDSAGFEYFKCINFSQEC